MSHFYKKHIPSLIFATAALVFAIEASAEAFISANLGWTFDTKLKSIKGNENLNYPGAFQASNSGDDGYYSGTRYTNIKLEEALQGGVRAGYFMEDHPSLGLELEANYSEPSMARQSVTFSHPGFIGVFGQDHATEDQAPANVKLLQFNLNGLYRYQGLNEFIPYIGGGPSLNIIRITGTGYSGVFTDPFVSDGTSTCNRSTPCPNVHDTSVNLGANFKMGAEYKIDKDWGVGAEYHFNWVPVNIDHFRSANYLKADMTTQSLGVNLTRHF